MTDDLIEQLADRLRTIYTDPEISAGAGQLEIWRAVARECVRQMAWSRLDGRAEVFDSKGGDLPLIRNTTLTLAPPEWKP